MTRQVVTTTPHNSGLGDPAFTAFEKLNANDAELYAAAGATGASALSAATYAIARTLSGTTTGDRLQVLGRTTQSDGGQGLFTWVAGGATTVDEGYVLQATGGTWQRVDPSPTTGETLLNAVWFNIKPGNADTVNDTGFAKLKAQMQTSGTTTWRVYFPPGAYTYTNNRWLFGVMKFIIEAYDCTFQSTSADANYANCIPLFNGSAFDESGDTAWPHSTYTNGYLFNTAAAGSFTITTTTAADAGNFTPGMRVLLHGYDEQGPGDPDMRYFETKTVLTAVAGTGVVTFTDALRYFYDSRWWDTPNYQQTGVSLGAPRILSLERANYKRTKLGWVKGATFLRHPTVAVSGFLQLTGDLLIYEDVTVPAYTIGVTDIQIMRRCTAKSADAGDKTGPDKIVDRVIVEDSLFDVGNSGANQSFVDCVGCNSVTLIRSKFFGSVRTISPRSLSIDDCDIVPVAADFAGIGTPSTYPIRAVTIRNTRIYNTGGLSYGFMNVASPGNSLTVGSVVGTDIRITFDATGKTIAHQIEYGMTLTNTVTGNTGIITAIYYETGSPGTLRIAGTWTAPTAADVFNYYDVMQVSDGGGNVIVGTQVPFWRGPPLQALRDSSLANLTATGTATVGTLALSGTTSASSLRATGATSAQLTVNGGVLANFFSGQIALGQILLTLGDTKPLQIPEGGSPAIAGFATLVGGTVTVSNAQVTSASYAIVLTRKTAGGTLGHLSYSIVDFTSFTITSSSGTDTSTVYWVVIRRG